MIINSRILDFFFSSDYETFLFKSILGEHNVDGGQ